MPSERELPLLLRQFRGVNIAQDSAFVDPSYCQESNNWVPDQFTYLLTKRRGTLNFQDSGIFANPIKADFGITTYDQSGARHVYVVTQYTTADALEWSSNDSTFGPTGGPDTFATFNHTYGGAVLGGFLYTGNGVDALLVTPIGGASTGLQTPLVLTNIAGAAAAPVADNASLLDNGTYSYCWAVYNTVTKVYVSRGIAQTVTLVGARARITFTSPAAALGANQVYLLFVAPRNLPLEFGHSQVPAGLGAAANWDMSDVGGDGPLVPVKDAIVRKGNILVAHRGRLFIAGDQSAKSKVYATSIIVPGLEQTIFDQGDFYPANAVLNVALNDGNDITGLAVATATDVTINPQAPLLIFKNTSTWALLGDIVDDDSASLVQLSGRVGCISHRSIVNTPVGVLFCGVDSVYLIRPDTLVPIDVGWPIAPAIRAIPPARRSATCAVYHRGFYKLAITPADGGTNNDQWWLDLRQGLGQTTPSWWGPHRAVPVAMMWTGYRDPNIIERLYAILENTTRVIDLDRSTFFDDGEPIVSRLKTKQIDSGQPFQRKLFTRCRINAKVEAGTELMLHTITDGGIEMVEPNLVFPGSPGAIWNVSDWNVSDWSFVVFAEGESIFNVDRPRARAIELRIEHREAVGCDLRDFEIRYIPKDRPVAV